MANARVALQLYTVRELAAHDFVTTLERVAEAGYGGVELAGLHGVDAAVVRAACAAAGLAVAGAHIGVDRFESDADGVCSELETLGTPMLVFPSLPPRSGAEALERLVALTGQARARGLRPVFHNHAREFERDADGRRLWDAIVAIEGLELELDLGWAWVAGEEPARLLAEQRGRIPLVHLKDHVRTVEGAPDRPVGDGEVGYGTLIGAALEAGVEWLVVEQDEPGPDPLEAIARSLRAVNEILGEVQGLGALDA